MKRRSSRNCPVMVEGAVMTVAVECVIEVERMRELERMITMVSLEMKHLNSQKTLKK
jgi:hypothetical protein